jgi:serine/threonine-protein kinase
MGEVYKAIDPLIGRPVALKTITSSLAGDQELLDRFYREARSAGALEHPNIVTVYELGKGGDIPFIAMEFLEGESLEKIIARRPPLTLLEKAGYIVPVCRALEYAHRRGVVHRDIKPANIMIARDGKVKVVDFGIARLMNASHTQTNVFMGTISYMSPQMIYGQRADERSDIWALGVTFYELLCYQRPFEGDNHAALMLSIAQESTKHRPLTDFVPDCPPALENIISRMLEKDVNRRFQSMEEVLTEIEPFWENLRQDSVSGMVVESENYLQAKDFGRARDLLRKALQIDSRNTQAKLLLDQVNTEVRQLQTRSQIANIIEKAQKLQHEKRFKEAQTEMEGAVKLDPGSAEARDALAEVQRLIARMQTLEEGLQLTRQRLAEGAPSLAMQEVLKVLEIDPDNAQGRALQKQIQDLLARREEQKRIADYLQRARKFWAEQRYEVCVELLTEAQKEFPKDPEIAHLLEAAKLDHAEQQKLDGLAEAKGLLATQQFDQALAKTESLFEKYPNDAAIHKLRGLVLHEKAETERREKLSTEIVALRSRVNAGKFSDAVTRGEKLLEDFPDDTELAELVNFARAELDQSERLRKKEDALLAIQKKMEAGQFKAAVAAAEKALGRLSEDAELSAVLEQARAKLKESEDHELLQRRVAEIRAKINKGQHTDAVDLARQTLATLGHDDQAADLLRMAEIELAQKREREREQENQLTAARTVFEEGRYAEATQMLRGAFEARILTKKDPRVVDLLKRIKERKAAQAQPQETVAAPPVRVEESPPTEKTLVAFATAVPEPVRTGAPQPASLPAADASQPAFSSTVVSGAAAEPELTLIAPAASNEIPMREEQLFRLDETTTQKTMASTVARPSPIQQTMFLVRKYPIPFAAGALVVVAVIVATSIGISNQPTRQDLALRSTAQQLEQQKNWPAALSDYETLGRSKRGLAPFGKDNAARLRKLLNQEASLLTAAQEREAAGDAATAKSDYQQLAGLHGDLEQEALSAVARLDTPIPSAPHTEAKETPHKNTKSNAGTPTRPSTASETPKTSSEPCQVATSDIPKRLDHADQFRGAGHYADAERIYKEVLACQPTNERAIGGLEKTKRARQTDLKLPSSN